MIINNNAPVDEAFALRNFPNIDVDGFQVTSELDPSYNCFAWAGGDTKNNWFESNFGVWHTESTSFTLDNILDNFSRIGYTESSETSDLENGYDKVAIYVDEDGDPSHAARQLETGKWTSKLGIREDIEHKTPECLNGISYGLVKVILKRPKKKNKKTTQKQEPSKEFENFKSLAKGLANVSKEQIANQKRKAVK